MICAGSSPMISFHKLNISKPWLFWKEKSNLIIFCYFLVLLMHSATIGLTDDEAYYWVLAQRPAFAYSYHPPAMAWFITITFQVLKIFSSSHLFRILSVRLPAVLSVCASLAIVKRWLERVTPNRE